MRDLLTTGEVAKACKVSINTVIAWVDKGFINCLRLPSGHRRIERMVLREFMAKNNIPLEWFVEK